MKRIFIFFTGLLIIKNTVAQDSLTVTKTDSINNAQINTVQKSAAYDKYPYKTSFRKDAPVITAGIGLSVLGLKLISDKKNLTDAELATKTKDKIPSFDRGNAGYYDDKINDDSYLPFHASFAMPVVMLLLNGNERRNASSICIVCNASCNAVIKWK
jgi:hypothetical protein